MKKASPLTTEQESEIIRLYKLNVRGKSIASFTGATLQQVNRVLYVKNSLRLRYRNWTMNDIIDLKDKYINENKSFSDLGREYRICPTWLKIQMESAGWTKKDLQEERRKR